MLLSIIIPVYNEARTINVLLRKVLDQNIGSWEKEIIVVNDASTDSSLEIINRVNSPSVKVASHKRNQGKGAAIHTGLRLASGDFILIQDADLEYDPADYLALIAEIEKGAQAVYGSRNLGKADRGYFLYYLGGRILTAVFNSLYRTKLTDINTGYKLIDAELIKKIPLENRGFGFCEEITAKLVNRGVKIREIPVEYKPRSFSEGKKIRWHDGFIGLANILKYRINRF